jgi:hypothetical protein
MARVAARRLSLVLLALGALAAPARAQTQADGSALGRIFTLNMLNAQVAYLESITGPAWKVNAGVAQGTEQRIYQIQGCQVTVGVSNGAVQSLGLGLSDGCSVDLSRFFNRSKAAPSANTMTFGDLGNFIDDYGNSNEQGSFAADCLDGCGNAYDPLVYGHYVGPQSDQNLEIVASASTADAATSDAASKWETLMQKQSGQTYVDNTTFNCDGKYDVQAASFLQNVKITSITIGWNLSGPWSSCPSGQ